MPRKSNTLSAIQRNDALFARTRQDVMRHPAEVLASHGLVSRTTIFKWLRREPVNRRMEKAILESVKLVDDSLREEDDKTIALANELANHE